MADEARPLKPQTSRILARTQAGTSSTNGESRSAKLARIQAQINEGSYNISSEAVAAKLLDHLLDREPVLGSPRSEPK